MNSFRFEHTARLGTLSAVLCLLSCATPANTVYEMPQLNRGPEFYSAWYGDARDGVLYFGLSAFWQSQWQAKGESSADLKASGDHLIGRFDYENERFLPPLRVRQAGPDARSSVWDVLAHSNGRVYFTTYFEEIGYVEPETGDLRYFEGIGLGFNELREGPLGNVYVTRYASTPHNPTQASYGSVAVLTPEGAIVDEFRIPNAGGSFAAPKSVAVDRASGEIWLNSDTFLPDGGIKHETIHMSANGQILSRQSGDPELHFMRFDPAGRGWFVESADGQVRVRVVDGSRELGPLVLGPRFPADFVQDIHFAADGTAVAASWSGIVYLIQVRDGALTHRALKMPIPEGCPRTGGPPMIYSGVLYEETVFATLHCGGAVARASVAD